MSPVGRIRAFTSPAKRTGESLSQHERQDSARPPYGHALFFVCPLRFAYLQGAGLLACPPVRAGAGDLVGASFGEEAPSSCGRPRDSRGHTERGERREAEKGLW
jgi:hypothetical protein